MVATLFAKHKKNAETIFSLLTNIINNIISTYSKIMQLKQNLVEFPRNNLPSILEDNSY